MKVPEAIASITSLEEMEGYIFGLKEFGAEVSRQEWSQIAHAKIALMRRDKKFH